MAALRYCLVALGLLALCAAATDKVCYYPDGTISKKDRPCNSEAGQSGCCNVNDVCYANGLCYEQTGHGFHTRGSCTDSTWKDGGCPNYCRMYTGPALIYPVGSDKWCCAGPFDAKLLYDADQNLCVNSNSTPFQMQAQALIYNRTDGSTGPNLTTTIVEAGSSSITILPSAYGASSASGSSSSSKPSVQHDAAIGVGVGAPLGIAAILMSVLWWRERKRRFEGERRWQDRYDAYVDHHQMVQTARPPPQSSPVEMNVDYLHEMPLHTKEPPVAIIELPRNSRSMRSPITPNDTYYDEAAGNWVKPGISPGGDSPTRNLIQSLEKVKKRNP